MISSLLCSLLVAAAPAAAILVAPEVATPQSPDYTPDRSISQVRLPVEIALRDLEQILEAQFAEGDPRGQLYSRSGIPIHPGTAEVEVRRNGRIAMAVRDDGTLQIAVPLHIRARGDWETPERVKIKVGPFRASFKAIQVKHHEEADASLTIHAAMAMSVSPDWVVRTRTHLAFSWDQKPSISVGPISIGLGGLAGAQIDKLLAGAGPKLDEAIARKAPLRAEVLRAWEAFQRPIRLAADPELWLRVEPFDITFSGLVGHGDRVEFALGLRARVSAVVGSAPAPASALVLPPLRVDRRRDATLRIDSDQRVAIAALAKGLRALLASTSLETLVPNAPVALATPLQFTLRASGTRLEAAVDLAVPSLDRTLRCTVGLEPVPDQGGSSVDLRLTGVALGWANGVTASPAEDLIRATLEVAFSRTIVGRRLSLARMIEPIQQSLQRRLASIEIAPGVSLTSRLDTVEIGYLRVEGQDLRFLLIVSGHARATVAAAVVQ